MRNRSRITYLRANILTLAVRCNKLAANYLVD